MSSGISIALFSGKYETLISEERSCFGWSSLTKLSEFWRGRLMLEGDGVAYLGYVDNTVIEAQSFTPIQKSLQSAQDLVGWYVLGLDP